MASTQSASTPTQPLTPLSTNAQTIKIIASNSSTMATPATSTSTHGTVTRIFQINKASPQQGITLAQAGPKPQNFAEQLAQQLKNGNLQLRLQGSQQSTGSTSTTITPVHTVRLASGQTLQAFSTGQTISTPVLTNAGVTLNSSDSKTGLLRGTPAGTRVIVQPVPKVTTPVLKLKPPVINDVNVVTPKLTPKVTSKLITASNDDTSSTPFIVTPEITKEIVRKALLNTSSSTSSDIHEKLLAMQRSTQKQVAANSAGSEEAVPNSKSVPLGRGGRTTKRARPSSAATPTLNIDNPSHLEGGDDEETQRLLACQLVLKTIIDRIDREEKAEARKKRMKEAQLQNKWRSIVAKNEASLAREAESLRREIQLKKYTLEEELKKEIELECSKISPIKRKDTSGTKVTNNSEGPAKRRKHDSNSISNGPSTPVSTPKAKSKPSSANLSIPPANSISKNKKLYCICKTSYDSSKYMVGCDICHNWFHIECLGLDEETVQKKKSWVCKECGGSNQEDDEDEEADEEESDEIEDESQNSIKASPVDKNSAHNTNQEDPTQLYCLCKQSYDESLFYIQCDTCQDWLHGKCVGIVSKEGQKLDTYNCPRCDPNSVINYCNQKRLDAKDIAALKSLLKDLKSFKHAWPFREAVDSHAVPDYYKVIKKPMDLATMDRKLDTSAYTSLAQFIGDVALICDNCRYYNENRSSFTTCANLFEGFFLQKIKIFRQQMIPTSTTNT